MGKLNKKIGILLCISFLMLSGLVSINGLALSKKSVENKEETTASVQVEDWNRRIYKLEYMLQSDEKKNERVRFYAGEHFHIVNSNGFILTDQANIDAYGNVTDDPNDGLIKRDKNGWYVEWKNPDLKEKKTYSFYVQVHPDYIGGNDCKIGVEHLSGIYAKKEHEKADVEVSTLKVNTAVEVQMQNKVIPVFDGMDLNQNDFIKWTVPNMESVYGNIEDLPLTAQWYKVEYDSEVPVGSRMEQRPFTLPMDAIASLGEDQEYYLKLFYNGKEASEEALKNSDGNAVEVSMQVPIAQASLKSEHVYGRIHVDAVLNQKPYDNGESFQVFRFRLYRFDTPNQIIREDTPYDVYAIAFEVQDDVLKKSFDIEGLSAGWYTLVPEIPDGCYEEIVEKRQDNNWPVSKHGPAAGIDFQIGQIIDAPTGIERLVYQGQSSENPIEDFPVEIEYRYQVNVYAVKYQMNPPEGCKFEGTLPFNPMKYPADTAVTIEDSQDLTAKGWQFVGWSENAGDGIYEKGDSIYSTESFRGEFFPSEIPMKKGGITLYGQWFPIYAVTYNGNTHTAGNVPEEHGGPVEVGSNLYYEGDQIIVKDANSLSKEDDDGTKYSFDGWSLNQDGSGERFYAGDIVDIKDKDLTFYAQWKTINTDKFAVNYIAVLPEDTILSGTLPKDVQKYKVGDVVTVQDGGTIQLEKYRFAGWSLESREDGLYQKGEELYGASSIGNAITKTEAIMHDQGLNFYSRWIPLYELRYSLNGGKSEDGLKEPKLYEQDVVVQVAESSQIWREGYRFKGWNSVSDGSGKDYVSGSEIHMPAEDLLLYAQWEKEIVLDDEKTESKDDSGHSGLLIFLAILGVVCIISCITYWVIRQKREE